MKKGKNDRKQSTSAPLDPVENISDLPREVCIWVIDFCNEQRDPARGGEAGAFQKLALRMPTLLCTHTRQRGRLRFLSSLLLAPDSPHLPRSTHTEIMATSLPSPLFLHPKWAFYN